MAGSSRLGLKKGVLLSLGCLLGATSLLANTADLVLQVSASPGQVVAGSPFTLSFVISNSGPDEATALVLTNPLPPSVILNSVVVTNGTYTTSNNVLAWFVDSLASQSAETVQLILTPVNVQTLTNRSGVVAAESDPLSANNLNRFFLITVKPVAVGAQLNRARMRHVATLLNDGKVLLTGGWTNGLAEPAGPAELYDPQAEMFVPAGALEVPRFDHSATLLPDGMVLIAGGNTGGEATAGIELYDPASGSFVLTNSLTVPRSGHTATRLPDGRVAIAGGTTNTAVEIFNYTNGTISSGGALVAARTGHVAALLPSGRILFAGGANDPISAEEYDPETGTSTPVGSMMTYQSSLAAAGLLSGKVLICGGVTAELYDPATKSFTLAAAPLAQRVEGRLTMLNDGRVLVSGGGSAIGYVSSTELYDPVTNSFTAGSPMTRARFEHSATRLQDGRVLIAGGWEGVTLSSSELFVVTVDTDHDGIDDSWELKYGLNPSDRNDAVQDADGDGFTNLQEFLAGTDPRDPTSLMRVVTAQVDSTSFRVQFTTVAGKRYEVERSTNFLSWETISNNVQGTGANAQVGDKVSSERAVYRVKLMR